MPALTRSFAAAGGKFAAVVILGVRNSCGMICCLYTSPGDSTRSSLAEMDGSRGGVPWAQLAFVCFGGEENKHSTVPVQHVWGLGRREACMLAARASLDRDSSWYV